MCYFYLSHHKLSRLPRIFYGTRTHKQIANIIRELRRTVYAADLRYVFIQFHLYRVFFFYLERSYSYTILASREQTCINPALEGSSEKTNDCKLLVNASYSFFGLYVVLLKIQIVRLVSQKKHEMFPDQTCQYYVNLKSKYPSPRSVRSALESKAPERVWDIEDITKANHKFCPYFALTRTLASASNLIICPYSYLLGSCSFVFANYVLLQSIV